MLENDLLVTLFADSPIVNRRDMLRLTKGLACTKQRFLEAMLQLADSVRSLLRDGVYSHPCPQFIAADEFGRPLFLGDAFSLIVDEDLRLRADYPGWIAAHMICLLGSCKKMTPCKRQRPVLAARLVAEFVERQRVSGLMTERINSFLEYDLPFATSFRYHYNRYVSLFSQASTTRPSPAFGPGANVDRLDAALRDEWLMPYPSKMGLADREFAHFCYSASEWRPRYARMSSKGLTRLRATRKRDMHFHAVPKSIKSYRGVGKTDASVMGMQLALQRAFYLNLPKELPLKDATRMADIPDCVGTIDLSAASDTLNWDILLQNIDCDALRRCLDSVRIRRCYTNLGRIDVNSPMMGEGITFPLMSAYFCAVAMAVCDIKGGGHEFIRVYGDDIQTCHFEDTIAYLEILGHSCNRAKSYPPHSRFKESCDYHYVADSRSAGFFDARPRYVPSSTVEWHNVPRLIPVVDTLRIIEWLWALGGGSFAFKHFFPPSFPYSPTPSILGYPSLLPEHGTSRKRVVIVPRSNDLGCKPMRAALSSALRSCVEDHRSSHGERQAELKRLRRVPHKLVYEDAFRDVDRSFYSGDATFALYAMAPPGVSRDTLRLMAQGIALNL